MFIFCIMNKISLFNLNCFDIKTINGNLTTRNNHEIRKKKRSYLLAEL